MVAVLIITGIAAFLITLIGTEAMRHVAPRLGLVAMPSPNRFHREPTPRGGGVAIFVGIWVTAWVGLLLAASFQAKWLPGGAPAEKPWPVSLGALVADTAAALPRMRWAFGGAVAIAILGLIDDRRGLPAWFKLMVQTAVASCIVFFDKQVISLFIPNFYVCAVVTILWFVGIMNAFNLLDNMDGLSAGVGVIVSALLAIVAVQTNQMFLAALALVIAGALGGFLVFNFPPARIFMGDCGSMLIGFMMAWMTVDCTFYTPGKPLFPVVVPLLILAVPIFDTISVIVIRLKHDRSPFEGDTNHFSHRLVALGMGPRTAILTIYLVAAAIGLSATLIYYVTTAVAAIVLMQATAIFAVIVLVERAGRLRQR